VTPPPPDNGGASAVLHAKAAPLFLTDRSGSSHYAIVHMGRTLTAAGAPRRTPPLMRTRQEPDDA